MSTAESSATTLTLVSSEKSELVVEKEVAMEMLAIKALEQDNQVPNKKRYPLDNVKEKILAMVIEFCEMHVACNKELSDDNLDDDKKRAVWDRLKNWDAQFIGNVDNDTLYQLIQAANYLEVKSLLDLALQFVADAMKGKQPDEIRRRFGIVNDYTQEEEDEVRKENSWAWE